MHEERLLPLHAWPVHALHGGYADLRRSIYVTMFQTIVVRSFMALSVFSKYSSRQ